MRHCEILVRIPFFRLLAMDHYDAMIVTCFTLTTLLQLTLFSIKQYQLVKHNQLMRELQQQLDYAKRRKRQALLLLKQRRKAV